MKIAAFLVILFALAIKSEERQKRFLTFPPDSATGILVAIAVPIDLRYRNVFLSYNFEANYGMPEEAADYIPGPLERLEIVDRGLEGDAQVITRNSTVHKRSSGQFFTRRKIYRTLESYLQCHGHKGRACLLRTICEASESPLHDNNGLLGDLLHVILTPSTSDHEDLHPEYYAAEELGRSGDCSKYSRHCPECILDLISRVLLQS
ncbi:uncharacterized protein LOC132265228 [Phlebotomus argentipes]|uniref:uncharacterized protein LOC132265228 n=1 Tax=Phlebotomus argentipes TaxID=94469 RepID=UPI00289353EB|nr:uncharacterized protein LOC132265228 [Phlebotomus argentipes]